MLTLLILIAAICQGLRAWAVLAGALALACQFDPATIGLPAVHRTRARCALWVLVFAIGVALMIAGSTIAAQVIGVPA